MDTEGWYTRLPLMSVLYVKINGWILPLFLKLESQKYKGVGELAFSDKRF